MTLTIKKHPQTQGNAFYNEENEICLICDPKTLPKTFQHIPVVITFLQPETSALVTDPTITNPLYLPQELYTILQKAAKFALKAPLNQQIKILPYGYAQKIAHLKITAERTDDLNSDAIVLLVQTATQTIGYAATFSKNGLHKSRIKKWKKHFKQAQLDQLVLADTFFQNEENTIFNPNQILKQVKNELSNAQTDEILTFSVPFANLALLSQIKVISTQTERKLVLTPAYAGLLRHFYPYDEDFIASAPDDDNLTTYLQQPDRYFFQAELLQQPAREILNVSAPVHSAPITQAELNDLVKYVAPKELLILE
ncbi:hypothetical protein [Ligilactobacillus ceti]|uniref:Uncharacterized protein n=1 Tax=Ligilactobacillus ceti DSM 22408 TaxID=1122146 RepID=A0A0R2KHM9_9LACO|nr:hypothetical protein [Ligilactobacillus ceti]KRN88779.1 hypothetical protein IV53_GL000747 [Ligilactobacillus ceti DSM 22408]